MIDTAGSLYGVFQVGGPLDNGKPRSNGVLFKLMPGAHSPFQLLYVFCRNSETNCGDGADGFSGGHGTVFALDIARKKLNFDISFCRKTHCVDTDAPRSTLYSDDSGAAFGTTHTGGAGTDCGATGCGTLYRVDIATKKLKVLHSFAGNTADGASPFGSVVQAGGGYFGTTSPGETYGYGTVYELTPLDGERRFAGPWTFPERIENRSAWQPKEESLVS